MGKHIVLIIITLFVSSVNIYSQDRIKLDSLFSIWNDNKKADTVRLEAINQFIVNGYINTRPDSAVFFAQLQYDYALSKSNKRYMSNALNSMGLSFMTMGNHSGAIKSFSQSLKLEEDMGNKKGIGRCLTNMANIYYDQGDKVRTIEYIKRSLDIFEEIGFKKGIATSLDNLGTLSKDSGEYENAINYHLRSLAIDEERGDKWGIAYSLDNIGIIYRLQGDFSRAIEYHTRALSIEEEVNNKRGITRCLNNIEITYNKKKDYKNAIIYGKQGLQIAQEIGDAGELMDISYDLYLAYKNTGDIKNALEMHELYFQMRDSIRSEQSRKEILSQQFKYDYEKRIAIDSIAHTKEIEIKDLKIAKIEEEKKVHTAERNGLIVGIGLMIILAVVVYRNLWRKKKDNALLKKQKQEILEKNEELNQLIEEVTTQRDMIDEILNDVSQSIDYATHIQESILPKTELLNEYVSDSFVFFRPKDRVSGDFYWWTHLENHTIITAADCTGHGVPGAFMSMLGISFLREIVMKEYITHTGVILRKLRKEIINVLRQKGVVGEQKDGMDMAIISINREDNTVQFSGANNPLYLLRSGVITEYKGDKMPIAIYEKMEKYNTYDIQLQKGDLLFLFSDGFPDQFGGPDGKKFKYKPFKQLLVSIANKPMNEQKEILNTTFENWKANEEQVDDVVIVGIKI